MVFLILLLLLAAVVQLNSAFNNTAAAYSSQQCARGKILFESFAIIPVSSGITNLTLCFMWMRTKNDFVFVRKRPSYLHREQVFFTKSAMREDHRRFFYSLGKGRCAGYSDGRNLQTHH